jgi:UDPglucose 6-dehydrogenase
MERFAREYPDLNVTLCATPEDVARDTDAVVLVTEWQQYRDLDWEEIRPTVRTAVVLDGRNVLDRAVLARAGYRYLTLAG